MGFFSWRVSSFSYLFLHLALLPPPLLLFFVTLEKEELRGQKEDDWIVMSSCAPQESLLQRTNDTTAVQQTDARFKDSTLIHPLTFLIRIWNCPEILKTPLSAHYGLHSSYFESMRPFQIKVVRVRAVLGPLMDTGVRLLLCQRWLQYVIPLTAPAVLHLLLPVQRGEL